ncbi:alpha-ketoglutarate-dependent dioxygenase AlkB family protein [Muriicola sp. Z0-33]|uniref:alpha-ketoglutarate-dependent dioxygenase AlkB family protein n=1 Tax=Muriicola sp. Z0-33 TaxID=2816957 RepID=UPI0022388B3E|nr:alpha-ketoglutarate-dependent dioxygenase AlkB [Muriicola sp. Z0-33]MCW5517398.1 alpha-ketoglutarate-dependent dioxygenase AlkB [Muriicola sp. Z0-33]
MRLFPRSIQRLKLPESSISYYPGFFTTEEADHYLRKFMTDVLWQQDDITVFGKAYPQPRLTALYANNENSYSYSNVVMEPHPFTEELYNIKQRLKEVTPADFTTCLLNLYRDGQDSNGWHADDEKELGDNPVIASVSFGQERFFHLRHKWDKSLKHKILLEHGSLLLMAGETQHYWQHQIPKTSQAVRERINLTFRVIQ